MTFKELLKRIATRDHERCRYCGVRTFGDTRLDLVVPRHHGGALSIDNLVSICPDCEQRKQGLSLAEAGMALLDPIA